LQIRPHLPPPRIATKLWAMPTDAPLPMSVCTVCCNSESTLGRTLDSVQGLCSEFVALDSGSTDTTIDLLQKAGATIVNQPWLGFAKQSQRALESCTKPWVLHLDSDESLTPELCESIRQAIVRDDPTIAGYDINRKVWYADRPLEHAWQPEWRLRLVRRELAHWVGYNPHAHMEIIPSAQPNRVAQLMGDMRHDSIDAGITEFLKKQATHAKAAAKSCVEMGRAPSRSRLVFSPVSEFAKQLILRSAWRDGWRGWVASSASAVAVAMKHAAIFEEYARQRAESNQ